MAVAPGHKLGEKIGWFLENFSIEIFKNLSDLNEYYIDYKHERAVRFNKSIVTWTDLKNNKHNLDIVFERHGSESKLGLPCAFIEVAWRKYTKHSKNKVQEISAAILPIVEKYKDLMPFYGVVLGGNFTKNALNQLSSNGFKIIYFSEHEILNGFNQIGLDLKYSETSTDKQITEILDKFNNLSESQIKIVQNYLYSIKKDQIQSFETSLSNSLKRYIVKIEIASLFGENKIFYSICDVIAFIKQTPKIAKKEFIKFEIHIVYSNHDEASFVYHDKDDAINHLKSIRS